MIKGIIAILLCFSFLLSFAQTSNVEQEFKRKIESLSNKNKTIYCDFTQTKKVKNIKQPVKSRGLFYYDNSGLMSMIYTQPQGDKVVMNDDVFTIVANGKKITTSASSNPLMAQISFMMQACMAGNVSNLGRGWNMKVDKNEDGYQVVLTPTDRRVKKYISGMMMIFDEVNTTLNTLRIEESLGGYTEYHFLNKKLNQKIDSSYFKVN